MPSILEISPFVVFVSNKDRKAVGKDAAKRLVVGTVKKICIGNRRIKSRGRRIRSRVSRRSEAGAD